MNDNPYTPPQAEADDAPVAAEEIQYPLREEVLITLEVFVRAMAVHNGRTRAVLRVFAAATAAPPALVAVMALRSGEHQVAAIMGGFAAFLATYALIEPILFRRQLRLMWREIGMDRAPVRFEISPECARIISADEDVRVQWSAYCKTKERNGILLAYRTQRMFHVFPVEYFAVETQRALRVFLNAAPSTP